MVAPTPYSRLNAYTDWSVNNPGDPHPGQDFDEDFDALSWFTSALLAHLSGTIRDDGRLADNVIDGDGAFTPEYLADLRASISGLASSGIQGPAGPQGFVGPRGVVGPKGPPLPWIVSTGYPSPNIGIPQQLFLNSDNGDVYQKGPSSWLLLTNIRGPSSAGGGGASDHGSLVGLSDPDHPISAVQGLQEALTNLQTALVSVGAAQRNAYYQATAPTSGLNAGDLWFHTGQSNRMFRYDGAVWVDVADKRIDTAMGNAAAAISAAAGAQAAADGKVTTFFGSSPPVSPQLGDLWFRSDQGNKVFRWNTTIWALVQDSAITQAIQAAATAQNTADGKIVTYYQPTTPAGARLGDLWINTGDGNHTYRFNGAQWLSIRDASIAQAALAAANALSLANQTLIDVNSIADGVVEVFYAPTPPAGASLGDLWINTTLGNQLHRFNGTQWVSVQDTAAQTALTSAQLAQDTADGKIRAFYQTTPPLTGRSTGDLWFDSDDRYRPYRFNGSVWADITSLIGVEDGLVTGVTIQHGAVTASHLETRTIKANSGVIDDLAITTAMIADASITKAKIANLTVGTAQIENAAITTSKLGAVSIDNAQIANAAITSAKIQDLTVGTDKIFPQSISNSASARADTSLSTSGSATLSVLTCSITTTGGRVYVWWAAQVNRARTTFATYKDVRVRLRRGGTTMMDVVCATPPGEGFTLPPGTYLFDETLPAGSYTYEIVVQSIDSAACDVTTRSLLLMELKR